jgi:hypothetical protein
LYFTASPRWLSVDAHLEPALQAREVGDADVALVDVHQPLLLEGGEGAADRLELHAEVTADLGAAHAQVELALGIAARRVALRQVQQEGREPLLGVHAAEQHHQAVLAQDFAAHQPADDVLHAGVARRGIRQAGIGDRAQLGVLQCHRGAGVLALGDAVQAHQFAGDVEAAHLLAAVGEHQAGLERAGAHGMDAGEPVAFAVQGLAGLHLAPRELQAVEATEVELGHAAGQAQLAQVAGRTPGLHRRRRRRRAGFDRNGVRVCAVQGGGGHSRLLRWGLVF